MSTASACSTGRVKARPKQRGRDDGAERWLDSGRVAIRKAPRSQPSAAVRYVPGNTKLQAGADWKDGEGRESKPDNGACVASTSFARVWVESWTPDRTRGSSRRHDGKPGYLDY